MLTKWSKYPELSLKKEKNNVMLNNATLLDVGEKIALHWKGYIIFKKAELHFKLLTKKLTTSKQKQIQVLLNNIV